MTDFTVTERTAIREAWACVEVLAEIYDRHHVIDEWIRYERRGRHGIAYARSALLSSFAKGLEGGINLKARDLFGVSWGCQAAAILGAEIARPRSCRRGTCQRYWLEKFAEWYPKVSKACGDRTQRALASLDQYAS